MLWSVARERDNFVNIAANAKNPIEVVGKIEKNSTLLGDQRERNYVIKDNDKFWSNFTCNHLFCPKKCGMFSRHFTTPHTHPASTKCNIISRTIILECLLWMSLERLRGAKRERAHNREETITCQSNRLKTFINLKNTHTRRLPENLVRNLCNPIISVFIMMSSWLLRLSARFT